MADEFQSTLPVWGATRPRRLSPGRARYFNPRSPCGERPRGRGPPPGPRRISIHAPRVGSDRLSSARTPRSCYFNPRSPCGERLIGDAESTIVVDISIHAPRVGSDLLVVGDGAGVLAISIHAPRVGSDTCRYHDIR